MSHYYELMASLPYLPPVEKAKLPPLNRIQLERRLGFLTDDDLLLLRRVEAVAYPGGYSGATDAAAVAEYEAVMGLLGSASLRNVLRWYLQTRTILSALRLRKRGALLPSTAWGESEASEQIARSWTLPAFQLDRQFPMLTDLVPAFQSGDALAVERLLVREEERMLQDAQWGHEFDLVAVVLYVLRWDLIHRWTSLRRDLAVAVFANLVDTTFHDEHLARFEDASAARRRHSR